MKLVRTLSLLAASLLVACGASTSSGSHAGGGSGGNAGASGAQADGSATGHLRHVIVITMENHDESSIIGSADAPYINGTLLRDYASASSFVDVLPIGILSEPHYVLMEAGTATFSDHTFDSDAGPSATNSTSSTQHLSTQLDAAGVDWVAFQEGIDATSGACPVQSSGFYQPKHDPFVFFQDVSGRPPSKDNARCAAHHADFVAFSDALDGKRPMPPYAFVTPNLCHDMHGATGCPSSNLVRSGDDWLAEVMPRVISYVDANDGVALVVWDEGESAPTIPFLAVGPHVKKGGVSSIRVTHASLVKSVEEIFGLPVLSAVQGENDLGDFFEPGWFP